MGPGLPCGDPRRRRGGWRLTTAERKAVSPQAHLRGDLDAQAVEVTRLSLLLKVLEGETEETLPGTA